MIVPSGEFLLFAIVGALIFNLFSDTNWQRIVFMLLCLAFLGSYSQDPLSFVPLAGFLVVGYAAQFLVNEETPRAAFIVCVTAVVLLFAWLKRYAIFPSAAFIAYPYLQLGMSYLFFRILHVIIDRHQGVIEQPIGFFSYTSYLLNFTAMVSGPIQRYEDYREAEVRPLPLDATAIGTSVRRIAIGCFKVMVVSTILHMIRGQIFENLDSSQGLVDRSFSAALFIASYALYLYYNFSGYTDVVIGVARLYRKPLPENFDHPFSSPNFITFWSRWHITLSNWLKTYIYNPFLTALMERFPSVSVAPMLAVVAFFVTFSLVGVWHGQTSEFLLFGILQGGGVAINKLYQVEMTRRMGKERYRRLSASTPYIAACRGLTFTYFAFTLLWFALDWQQIERLATEAHASGLLLGLAILWIGSAAFLHCREAVAGLLANIANLGGGEIVRITSSRYAQTAWVTGICVTTIITVVALNATAPEIVYKAF